MTVTSKLPQYPSLHHLLQCTCSCKLKNWELTLENGIRYLSTLLTQARLLVSENKLLPVTSIKREPPKGCSSFWGFGFRAGEEGGGGN